MEVKKLCQDQITLFTAQWGDMTIEELAKKSNYGDLMDWSWVVVVDHFDV